MSVQAAVVLVQESQEIEERSIVEVAQGLALLRDAGFTAAGHLVRTARQRDDLAAALVRQPPRLVFLAVDRNQIPGALALLNALRRVPASTHVAVGGQGPRAFAAARAPART